MLAKIDGIFKRRYSMDEQIDGDISINTRYPTPQTVTIRCGFLGFSSIFSLSHLMWTVSVCCSEKLSLPPRTGKEDKLTGLHLGADDYIEKPYDIDIMLAKIDGPPAKWRSYRECR